ncbi:cell division protein ZapB [Nonomuraea sp. CA-141351]|uniref:cell division protein ZapB n=1 Tax=Nonomuraea sp. CA-141351 TaxID=3239996 RepID=UPI003D8D6444
MEFKLSPTAILDRILAAIDADPRQSGSGGSWDRDVRRAGLPVIASHVIAGTFKLGKDQPNYADDMIACPEGVEADVIDKRDGNKPKIFRSTIGKLALGGLKDDDPLAQTPAPTAEKLRTMRAEIQRAEELMQLRARVAELDMRNADLQQENTRLTEELNAVRTELNNVKAANPSPKPAPKGAAKPASGTASK